MWKHSCLAENEKPLTGFQSVDKVNAFNFNIDIFKKWEKRIYIIYLYFIL